MATLSSQVLRYLSIGGLEFLSRVADGAHGGPEFAGEVSLEAAYDLGLGLAFGGAPGDVVLGCFVMLHADHYDALEHCIRRSVATATERVRGGHPRERGDGFDAAEPSECRLVADPLGVVAGHYQPLGGCVRNP